MFGIEWSLLFLTIVAGQTDPYFTQSPKNTDVIQGESVTLPCAATPGIGMTYYWELNGSKIANTTRRYQKGSNLHITRVDRERDSGQFTCIASMKLLGSSANSITSSGASLNIQWIDDVSVQLQEPESASFITEGNEVILRCHTDASGDVHYEWFRNNDRLVKTSKIEIKKKKLHIKAVQPSDNGVYRCIAKNEAGTRHSTTNFALAVSGGHNALIQVVPTNQLVAKGKTAFFNCQYQHADVTEWYFKETGPLENGEKYTIHSNGTLQINNVGETDEGFYNCVGIRSESAEVPQSYIAELKLAYIKNFTASSFEPPLPPESPEKMVAAEGSTFQLTCLEPDSLPLAKKWWMTSKGHTISDSGQIRVDDDGRLIIDKVEIENGGIYKCVAENIAGKTEKNVEIVVTTEPKILTHPISLTVDENEQSLLSCEYEAKNMEYTTVKWRKDGKIMRHDYEENSSVNNNKRIQIFKNNGSLVIYQTVSSDRGEYACEVETKGFKPVLSQPATLSIIETLKFAPPPVNKKLELGSVAKVHCKAQGSPPPIIRWEKDGTLIENFNNHISDMNGTLHFNGVLNEDKGKYVCIATNSQGIINVTINIDVVVAPKFTLLPKNPTEVNEGETIMMDCVVEGDPKPTIQWDKNLKMNDFDQSRFTVLENGSLLISEVHRDDENKYGCTAGNSAGLNRKEIQLIVHSDFHPDDSTVTKAVLITMSVAGAYIVLVIGLMVWCRFRRRSRKLPVTDGSKTENGDVEHTELKENTTNGHCQRNSKLEIETSHKEGQKSDGAETTHSHSSQNSKKSTKSNYDKLALSRTHLKDSKLIGRGEFGDVLIAKLPKSILTNTEKRNSNLPPPSTTTPTEEIPVLVKALTQTKDEHTLLEFKREIDMLAKMAHENVTKLFGLCRETEPHYMIVEHTDWGDLKQFLVATQKGTPPPLTGCQSVAVAHQLSRGMDHLAGMRLVHRDLAARNCLITSTLVAKVGMPRLSRDPYSQEYCKHLNQVIPLRWLPHEAVYEDEYSTKSDIYSFGVVLLEIFSQGELPFPKMNDNSFLTKLKEKKLEWKIHPSTPQGLHILQESCWDVNPQNRPTFNELTEKIEEVLKTM